MNGCESDLHYQNLCEAVAEVVFDIKGEVNPTHGWFATHLHAEDFPRIVLRDMGIYSLASYVGYCDTDWFMKRNQDLDSGSRLVSQALPPKMLFCKDFLDNLPVYFHYDEKRGKESIGHLAWYMSIQMLDDTRFETFVHCTMQGHHFVWNLRPSEKPCHTIGLWRD